jgi:DNA-binding CsgD family transcriptional regulator
MVLSGAEIAAVTERFYLRVMAGAAGFVAAAAAAALVVLPLRTDALAAGDVTTTAAAAAIVSALGLLAAGRSGDLYRALRRSPVLELPLALLAAILVSVVSPLRNELWWPACAILMLLGVVAPVSRALAYCAGALTANLVAHVAADDLGSVPAVAVIGLWIGMPLFTAGSTLIVEQLAGQLVRLNARRSAPPPLRVTAWTQPPTPAPPRELAAGGQPPNDRQPDGRPRGSDLASSRLTARQVEVLALMADGLRYREIADCLSISVRQVQRHVSQAIDRLGVANAYELVRTLVDAGILARPGEKGA